MKVSVFVLVSGEPAAEAREIPSSDQVKLPVIVSAIRDAERDGRRVTRVFTDGPQRQGVLHAVDLTLRLRAAAAGLSEAEMLALFELLPL